MHGRRGEGHPRKQRQPKNDRENCNHRNGQPPPFCELTHLADKPGAPFGVVLKEIVANGKYYSDESRLQDESYRHPGWQEGHGMGHHMAYPGRAVSPSLLATRRRLAAMPGPYQAWSLRKLSGAV